MSLRIPTPSPSLDQAAQACATQLRGHSFAGDFRVFWSTWRQYLEEHGQEDPHGRLAMRHITNVASGLLSYRSVSADRQEQVRQTRARWEAWMEVLPFDHQLNLVLDEYSPHQLHEIDFAWLKWNDWHALNSSPTWVGRSDFFGCSSLKRPPTAASERLLRGWAPKK